MLLFHKEVFCIKKKNMLEWLDELREEVKLFLDEKKITDIL